MTFAEASFQVSMHHDEQWFRASAGASNQPLCEQWRSGEILSTGGKILAHQTGHPDQWEITKFCDFPDSEQGMDQSDDCVEIDTSFIENVQQRMDSHVHPYVNAQGDFSPPRHDNGESDNA